MQTVTVKTITNELKAAFGGIKVKGARKALVKAAIVEALAQQAARALGYECLSSDIIWRSVKSLAFFVLENLAMLLVYRLPGIPFL